MSNNLEAIITSPSLVREQWLPPELAVREVLAFERRFGSKHLMLACHAALPLILNPSLINLIHINFLEDKQISWVAEVDFLLSPLCRPIDESLYEVEPSIREVLLVELENQFGWERPFQLAKFLQFYLAHNPGLQQPGKVICTQHWIAQAYIDPDKVVEQLTNLLDSSLSEEAQSFSLPEQIYITTTLELLADPLERTNQQRKYEYLTSNSRVLAQMLHREEQELKQIFSQEKLEGKIQQEALNILSPFILKHLVSETKSPEAENTEAEKSIPLQNNQQSIPETSTDTINIINYYGGRAVPVDSPDADADENLPCPYRGLFHFSPNDAEFFFGRERFVEQLFQATQKRHFIAVLGASGSGKSSVVLAGLVPMLQQQGHWLFTYFRPGSDPFYALAEALVRLYKPQENVTEQKLEALKLAEFIKGSISLKEVFALIHRNHPSHRVLLIADQFEELYTLCSDQQTRRYFLDTLLACFQSSPSQSPFSPVLVATMRADFLEAALYYRPFADALQNADVKLPPMNHEEISQVIVSPAQKLGVTFETGLVERILNDVVDEPGSLPMLEFVLTMLWNRQKGKQLTHAAYHEIGGAQLALAQYAEETYMRLNVEEQKQVQRIFMQLVRPGEGTEDTRRRATKEELGGESWSLVIFLANARLVVSSREADGQETVEIAHEALIRNWTRLRQWMEENRSFRVWQERLRSALRVWKETKHDEGSLLRGAVLEEAVFWLHERSDYMSKAEQDFIKVSLAFRDKENRPWWRKIFR